MKKLIELTLCSLVTFVPPKGLPAQDVALDKHGLDAPGGGLGAPPIRVDQIGAVAGKQYSGDGLCVKAWGEGAVMRCVFQRMEGLATKEGLWLTSTANGASGVPFRVKAVAVRRERISDAAMPEDRASHSELAAEGRVDVFESSVRFSRPAVTEEYTVSMNGVRQDFVIAERLPGKGHLKLELRVDGAKVERLVDGVRLVLADGGRRLNYHRLHVLDATGKSHQAKLQVLASNRLGILLDDTGSKYPLQIDPTFSDAHWITMGGFPDDSKAVLATAVDNSGNLYVGGEFTVVADVRVNHIAKWDGSSWSALGSGMDGIVSVLAVSGGDLYAGGDFRMASGVTANRIARWNGSGWTPLGSGMDGSVDALLVAGSSLYAGGRFKKAGGVSASCIARWDGSSWSALGSGVNGYGFVLALAESGEDLYVGGNFEVIGDVYAPYIAKWDGNRWNALRTAVVDWPMRRGPVRALAVVGEHLYVGGDFTIVSTLHLPYLAKWDGSDWHSVTPWPPKWMNAPVRAMAVSSGNLFVGGDFTTVGAESMRHIAKWDGNDWSSLGAGIDDSVVALAASGGDLYAGGTFSSAGGKLSAHLARALIGDVAPEITTQPVSQFVMPGGNVSFSVTVTGAPPLAYRWRKDGGDLTDGARIIGSASKTLTITKVELSDFGEFSVVVTNTFGNVASAVAVLHMGMAPAPCYPQYNLFPLTLGSWWAYDNGVTCRVDQVTEACGEIHARIVDSQNSGFSEIRAAAPAAEDWIGWHDEENTDFILFAPGSIYPPSIPVPMLLGFQRTNGSWSVSFSGGSAIDVTQSIAITATNLTVAIRTNSYPGCTELTEDLSYSGDVPPQAQVRRKYYFYPGVGCIEVTWWTVGGAVKTVHAVAWDIKPAPVDSPLPSIAEAVEATNLTWTTGGAMPWHVQTCEAQSIPYAVRSGRIGNSMQSWVQTSVTGPAQVSFWWKVSSRESHELSFYCNGVRQSRISEDSDWQQQELALAAGLNTLRWVYEKNDYSARLQDAAWLDQVIVTAVPGGPAILTQPMSPTVAPGEGVGFSVSASGAEPLTYRWHKDGLPLQDGDQISGATSATLTISSVQLADAGNYAVVVSNANGSVTSAVATLTILDQAQTFCFGDYYYPACAGNQWSYDSRYGSSSWQTLVRIEAVKLPLTFYTGRDPVSSYERLVNAVLFDQGDGSWTNYMGLDGWSYLGTHHDDGEPAIRFDPGFVFTNCIALGQTLSQASDIYADGVYAGQGTFDIECLGLADVIVPAGTFSGCLHLEFTYTLGGRTRVGEQWWALGIGPVKWIDANPTEPDVEVNQLRTFSIGAPPRISSHPQDAEVSVGSTARFAVQAIGDPPLGYSWRRDGSVLADGARISGSSSAHLIIASVELGDAGNYMVVVTNACDSVTSSMAKLTVVGGGVPTWAGTDDFSTGGIGSNWTVVQSNAGAMTVLSANDHASFIVPSASTDSQNAYLFWDGTPNATEDWTVEVVGHNSAGFSEEGSSQLQLAVLRTHGAGTSQQEGYRIAMARSESGAELNTRQWVRGDDIRRASADAPNADFRMRLVYDSTSGDIEAWYSPDGSGSLWTMLDTISLAEFSPGMTASDTFTFAILGNAYFGPIAEGELYVDDFSLSGFPLRFTASSTSADGTFNAVLKGPVNAPVVLQASSNMKRWLTIATNTLPAAGWPITLPAGDNQQFYRARLGP
ncbi:MAG: immunoglobulin domain-containing protein [Verrucomicrobiia bacterium]